MIAENVKRLLAELPKGVRLVAAAKTRTVEEIREAVEAGVRIIGENYVQEARIVRDAFGAALQYHFIGHLQRNKVRQAVPLFDMIETVDSARLAEEIDRQCAVAGKVMPVLIEINSGREPQKFGVFPEDAEPLIRSISAQEHVRVMGMMTMGPYAGDPEDARPFFAETKKLFDRIRTLDIQGVEMKHLSMGMTHSFRVALQEGADIVRIGTGIFGPRPG